MVMTHNAASSLRSRYTGRLTFYCVSRSWKLGTTALPFRNLRIIDLQVSRNLRIISTNPLLPERQDVIIPCSRGATSKLSYVLWSRD